jgi:hypothetical protein
MPTSGRKYIFPIQRIIARNGDFIATLQDLAGDSHPIHVSTIGGVGIFDNDVAIAILI